MKTKYKGKVPSTSGRQSQYQYDKLLSTLDVSSLKFLKEKYNSDIREYTLWNDLNDEDNLKEYQQIIQRKHMIDEELEHRNIQSVRKSDCYFDSQTGLVYDEDGKILYAISFNEDETAYVYHDLNWVLIEESKFYEPEDEEDEYEMNITPVIVGKKVVEFRIKESNRKNKDIYRDWEYWESDAEDQEE